MAYKERLQKQDASFTVSRLPVAQLVREAQRPAASFQRQAIALRGIPRVIAQQEQEVSPLFESEDFLSGQEYLARLLLDEEAMERLITYYAVGAEIDMAMRRLEDTTSEVIDKSTKGKRALSSKEEGVINTMLQVIDDMDFVDPFDKLPEGSPSLDELIKTNERESGNDNFFKVPPQVQEVKNRIPLLFEDTGDPEQIGMVAFLTYLAREGRFAFDDDRRIQLRQYGVSAETVNALNQIGKILHGWMGHEVRALLHDRPTTLGHDGETWHAVDIPSNSLLPVAFVLDAMDYPQVRNSLPQSWSMMVDQGIIPHLATEVANTVKERQRQRFYEDHGDFLTRRAANGFAPYTAFTKTFDGEQSVAWLAELIPQYRNPGTIHDDIDELWWERERLTSFLRENIYAIPGNEHIAAMYVTGVKDTLTIFMFSHDGRALAIQISPELPIIIRVEGIPGGYIQESKDFIEAIFHQTLSNLREVGYLNHPFVDNHTSKNVRDFRTELEEHYRQKKELETHAQPTKLTPTSQVTEIFPTETVSPVPTRRYTIVDPNDIIVSSDLSVAEIEALHQEIEKVEFSTPGTFPMKKLKGYKSDLRRIAIRRVVHSSSGIKEKVNLRAVMEFDGTTGTLIKVAKRKDVYPELANLLK